MTRICIYGAGAIGGYLGARLAQAGQEVTLIARGAHLDAMQKNGLTLVCSDGEEINVHPPCTDDPGNLGPQDYVILALKAPSVPGVLDAMQPLLGPETAVVPAVNGIPWWYFYRLAGPWENSRLPCVDPGDGQWQKIGPQRVIGGVVYIAAEVISPGRVHHKKSRRLVLGEPDGTITPRLVRLSRILEKAGVKAPTTASIRNDIWFKLIGNLAMNPISALTGATVGVIASDPGTQGVARAVMREAQAIGEKLGVVFEMSVDERLAFSRNVGAHKTSMLQDLERGRPMEIDALLKAVQHLGLVVGCPTPTLDILLALVEQRARLAGCYGQGC